MKPFIQILGITLSFSFLFACKKHSDDTTPGPNGTKLSKVIEYSSVGSVTSLNVFEYHYDAMNRVTEITHAVGDSSGGEAQAKPYETTRWYYNGNEQLPYRSTNNSGERYYAYDNQGRLIYDSVGLANCNCYDLKKYNWSNNKVICALTSGKPGGTSTTSFDSSVISGQDYLGRYNGSLLGSATYGTLYTYDNRINPLHTLNIHAAAAFTGVDGLPSVGYSENNNTEIAYGYSDNSGPGPVTFVKSQILTYKYNYNSYNLPVDCELSGNTPTPSRTKFYYTK